jgi:hypothetical protein
MLTALVTCFALIKGLRSDPFFPRALLFRGRVSNQELRAISPALSYTGATAEFAEKGET